MLTLQQLKDNCTKIHYFGLGFIQVKTGETERYHFYNRDLPSIMPEEEIHNHRYNFRSYILKGRLRQFMYQVVPGNDYLKMPVSCDPDEPCDATAEYVALHPQSCHKYVEGSWYDIKHDQFHRIRADWCITHVIRGPVLKPVAEVVRSVKAKSVCPFSKVISEDELWKTVSSML